MSELKKPLEIWTVAEIEPGWYEFRAVYINSQEEMETDIITYYIKNNEDLKRRRNTLTETITDIRDGKIINITYKLED